jgi:hypothetical protein
MKNKILNAGYYLSIVLVTAFLYKSATLDSVDISNIETDFKKNLKRPKINYQIFSKK